MFKKFNKTILFNYLYLMLLQGANFLLPLIVLPYLIKTLGLEKFGIIMIAASFITFFNILVDFGFNISATREVSLIRDNKEQLSRFFWTVLFIKLILIITGFLILLLLVYVIPKFRQEAFVYITTFGMVIGQALFPAWFFQGIEKMRVITIVNVTAKLIFTILIFLWIKGQEQYIYVPVLNSLGYIIAGLLGLAMSLKYIYFRKPVFTEMNKLMKDSTLLLVSNFSTKLYTSANTFILGIFAGNYLAGIYSSMEKLIMAMESMYVPLYQAIFPWLARKNSLEKRDFIRQIRPYIILVGSSMTLIIIIFADKILNLIYHNPDINHYSNVFRILSFIGLFAGLGMMYVTLLFPSLKMYKERMKVMLTGGIFNLILALILVQFFNIYGVAVSAVTTEFLIFVMAHWVYKNKISKLR